MSLQGQNVLITGASMGIGAAIARRLAQEKASLVLLARSEDKLKALANDLRKQYSVQVHTFAADVTDYSQLENAVQEAVKELKQIDILINNAGLALGAPNAFPELKVDQILAMTHTNIDGMMLAAYAVLNAGGMRKRGKGTIINVTSTTALEVPPFPGEAVYHSSKAAQEGFTNSLRTELTWTNIKVLALRPGVVATNFHEQRVGYDARQYNDFMAGFEPLVADDVAEAAAYMLSQKERVSIKALDVVPTAQRILPMIDKTWNERNGKS